LAADLLGVELLKFDFELELFEVFTDELLLFLHFHGAAHARAEVAYGFQVLKRPLAVELGGRHFFAGAVAGKLVALFLLAIRRGIALENGKECKHGARSNQSQTNGSTLHGRFLSLRRAREEADLRKA